MTPSGPEVMTIALQVAEPDLSDRIATLLSGISGIELVAADALTDLVLVLPVPRDGRTARPLTLREREVVALLAEGMSNKAIALRLGIAPDTAKFHVGRLIDKLDATGRTDAVALAARLGIIHLLRGPRYNKDGSNRNSPDLRTCRLLPAAVWRWRVEFGIFAARLARSAFIPARLRGSVD